MRATPTRDRVHNFIKDYYRVKGFAPSTEEIAASLQMSAPGVNYQIRKLHTDGRITRGRYANQIDISVDGGECLRCGQKL